MIDIAIPGYRRFRLTDLVCDFNGTLAIAGALAPGVRERLPRVAEHMRIHIVTGDTYGTARAELAGMPCAIVVLAAEGQAEAKARFARELGTPQVVAVGNGRNDRLLLEAADLAIGICGSEGIAIEALQASDIVVPDPAAALDLLLDTTRLIATLRS